tara:strand:- start:1456 stop:1827 length:372 start_codon:yes stop_codon:yes gene_type:complete
MRNFKNNRRKYRSNSYDRGLKINSNENNLNSGLGNVSDFKRKNYNRGNFNSPKLIQKYSDLAREALSIGDKILYENYMQHAEHFIRLSSSLSNGHEKKNGSSQEVDKSKIEKLSDKELSQNKI